MTSPPDDTTTDTSAIIAALQQRVDAGLAREAVLAEELAAREAALVQRNSEFSERIEQQAATIDVLKTMSASPGDAQPVFNLIVERARDLCDAYGATVYEFDGTLIHYRAATGVSDDAAVRAQVAAVYPIPATRYSGPGRAILDRRMIRIDDLEAEQGLHPILRRQTAKSAVFLPLLTGDMALGALALGSRERGGFTDSQIQLLETFAEQAVIAITSAETYRALQERTRALTRRNSEYGERIEQQAATIDVLKAMSASLGDARPVFELIVDRARAFCEADHATTALLRDDMLHLQAFSGMSAEYAREYVSRFPRPVDSSTMFGRAILSRETMQAPNVQADPALFASQIASFADFHTVVGVPMLRGGEPIGAIALGRRAPGGFSETQIELLKTFAEQAVIAVVSAETYRDLAQRTADLQQSLEYQTATSEVLNVISRSTFDLEPVFQTVAATAVRLCNADQAGIYLHQNNEYRWAGGYSQLPEYERIEREVRIRPGTGTLVGRVALEGRPVQILDAWTDTLYEAKADARVGAIHTLLGVPLLRDGSPIGVIGLGRQNIEPFTERQIELVSTFAAQAVIAMENARLLTEQREALEQQTATAELLQTINSSPGDPAPVFDAMLNKALRLCGAAFGALRTFDGDTIHQVASRNLPPRYAEYWNKAVRLDPANSVFRAAVLEQRTVQIEDMAADESYRAGSSIAVAGVELGGVRTLVHVPLIKDNITRGVLTIFRQEVRPFSDKQLGLLQNFADQAVIAMENARLLTEQREALEQQTATAEVLQVINASPGNLTPVFDAILDKAHSLCGATVGNLAIYKDGYFYAVATHGFPEQVASLMRHPMPPNSNTEALIEGVRFRQIEDIRAIWINPDYLIMRALVEYTDVRTVLFVPLRKDGALLGFISVNRPEVRLFLEKEIALLENFAAQAVIAMENARLINETREALEQQTATAEVLHVINSSPGDLAPVFDAMLEKAMRLCEAAIGVLFIADGDVVRVAQSRNVPPDFRDYLEREPPRLDAGSLLSRAMREQTVLNVTDLRETAPFRDRVSLSVAAVELGGIRSICWAPLVHQTKSLGLFAIFREEVRAFSAKQIALLENFAAQAVIAMENARLLTEQREALEQQTATAEVLQVINASPGDLMPVFDAMLEKAIRLCDAAFGNLALFDGTSFQVVANHYGGIEYSPTADPIVPEPGSALGRVVNGERVVQILDVADTDAYGQRIPSRVVTVERLGARTALWVALYKDNAVVGVFIIFRREVRQFSEKEIALLKNFAAQAVIAMENARLLTELRERTDELARRNDEYGERIEHQSATIDVLKAMSASPGDAQPVFDLITRRAKEVCNAPAVMLFEYDGKLVHFRSECGSGSGATPRALEAYKRLFPMAPTRALISCRAILERQIIEIRDITNEPDLPEVARGLGHRSNLAVPLLRDGAAIGAIGIISWDAGGFPDSQVELMKTFAEQAVIAISSADTFKELQRRTMDLTRSVAELQALEEVLRAVNSSLELETVLSTIISRAVQLSEADEGTIYEFNEAEQVFVPKSAYGMTAERVAALRSRRIKLGETHLGRSAILRAPVYVEDVQQDPSVPNAGDVLPGIHAVLAVPLLRNDTVIGGLVIRRRTEEGFAETLVTLMQTFSGQAVLAIENARLFQEAGRARTAAEAALVDLRRAQDRLVQSEKMASLGQLTAGIAHEIKNPLNFVNNFSDLSVDLLNELQQAVAPEKLTVADSLRTEIDDITTTLKSNLEKIAEHGRRADSIVKNMLLHSRTGPSEQRAIDVNTTVEEALNLAYHGARAETPGFNITMEKDLDPNAGSIDAFPQEFLRVMLNLISNGFYAARKRAAIEYKSFEPTLYVTTRNLDSQVEIRVRDNGTGIGDEVRDKIFEPFFTTKPAGEGTGLGLSLSYDIIVKQHGGQLTVDSRPNEFTEFQITLPRRMATSEGDRA